MKKKILCFLALIIVTMPLFTQVREDTLIFVPPVTGGRSDQAAFFKENFDMEITGAGYTITNSASEADYTMQLEIRPNIIFYDDGTQDFAPPGEPQFLLRLTLIRNDDNAEMVAFDFPFTALEEMYDFNLMLVYEAMANVPITRLGDVEFADESQRWRNKWLYIRFSIDYPVISAYMLKEPSYIVHDADGTTRPLDNSIGVFVGATVGLELQFLYWMSAEANFILRFSDPNSENTFVPGLGLQLKFPLKPSRHFMLEPYLMGNVVANTAPGNYHEFPMFAVGGGLQFGVKGGNMGAFFIDANYLYSIGDVVMKNNRPGWSPDRIVYSRTIISIGLGYKIGFFDRKNLR